MQEKKIKIIENILKYNTTNESIMEILAENDISDEDIIFIYKSGMKDAYGVLKRKYDTLIRSIISNSVDVEFDEDKLINPAEEGFNNAINKYDLDEYKDKQTFLIYAKKAIKNAILDYKEKEGDPFFYRYYLKKEKEVREEINNEYVDDKEFNRRLVEKLKKCKSSKKFKYDFKNITEEEIREYLENRNNQGEGRHQNIGNNNGTSNQNRESEEERIDSDIISLIQGLNILNEIEKKVINKLYGWDGEEKCTIEEMVELDDFKGVSPERIVQIQELALKKIEREMHNYLESIEEMKRTR
jgi:DNA-directed RNA polymerase specialized sigma subunit